MLDRPAFLLRPSPYSGTGLITTSAFLFPVLTKMDVIPAF
jgi:hypothetical protein